MSEDGAAGAKLGVSAVAILLGLALLWVLWRVLAIAIEVVLVILVGLAVVGAIAYVAIRSATSD